MWGGKIVGVKSTFAEASQRLFRLHQGRNFFEDTFSTLLTAECWFCIFTPKKKTGIFSRGVERASSVAYYFFTFCKDTFWRSTVFDIVKVRTMNDFLF